MYRALHSEDAQKILLSFKQVGKPGISKDSKKYFRILEKVKYLYKPNWFKECAFILFVTIVFLVACYTKYPALSILCFAISQVVSGWLAHSMNHSRNQTLHKTGNIIGPLFGGFTASWWGVKHNMHHMFTNSTRFDDDIKHEYYTPLYPFLYVKWRFDAFVSSIKSMQIVDLICLGINYYFISKQKIAYFVIGILIGGFYSANLLLGNHEREKRYNHEIKDDFIEHQVITCRNFPYEGLFWLTLMGGMQYQTEHHLFPQIPFYNLPTAKKIIAEELKNMGKEVIVGDVL